MRLYTDKLPSLLPIPFPRFFTPNTLMENGLLKNSEFKTDEFVATVPTLLRLSWGSSYRPMADQALQDFKYMKASVKQQLEKEYLYEMDDFRDVKERLEGLAEDFAAMDENDQDDSDSS